MGYTWWFCGVAGWFCNKCRHIDDNIVQRCGELGIMFDEEQGCVLVSKVGDLSGDELKKMLSAYNITEEEVDKLLKLLDIVELLE